MSVGFVSASTTTATAAAGRTGNGTFTLTLPSWSAGDFCLIWVYNDQGSASVTTPSSGWTALTGSPWGSATPKLYAWYRFMQAGDSSPVITIAGSGTNISHVGAAVVYSGVKTSAPLNVIGSATSSTGTPVTATGPTTTVDNCMAVALVGRGDNDGCSSPTFGGSGTGVNLRTDAGTNAGADSENVAADKLIASAGGTGNFSLTAAATDEFIALIVALAPAPVTVEADGSAVGTAAPGGTQPNAVSGVVAGSVGGECAGTVGGTVAAVALWLGLAASVGSVTTADAVGLGCLRVEAEAAAAGLASSDVATARGIGAVGAAAGTSGAVTPAAWASGTTYTVGQQVTKEGHTWTALAPVNLNREPELGTEWWTRGSHYPEYDFGTTYYLGDGVHSALKGYLSLQDDNTGNDLSDTDWWNLLGTQTEWDSGVTYGTAVSRWHDDYLWTAVPNPANLNRDPATQPEWWTDNGVTAGEGVSATVFAAGGASAGTTGGTVAGAARVLGVAESAGVASDDAKLAALAVSDASSLGSTGGEVVGESFALADGASAGTGGGSAVGASFNQTDASSEGIAACDAKGEDTGGVGSDAEAAGEAACLAESGWIFAADGIYNAEEGRIPGEDKNYLAEGSAVWVVAGSAAGLETDAVEGLAFTPSLYCGPWITNLSDRMATIWCRLDGAATVEVRSGLQSWSKVADATHDYNVGILIGEFEPASLVDYSVYVNGAFAAGPLQFRTLPAEGQPGKVDIVIIQDAHHGTGILGTDTTVNYRRLAALMKTPDIPRLTVCDHDYELGGPEAVLQNRRDRRYTARRMSYPLGAREVWHRTNGCVHIWGDHDAFGDNRAGQQVTASHRSVARQVHEETWPGGTYPDPLAIYRAIPVADCVLILTDDRMYRTVCPESAGYTSGYDYLNAEALGAAQIAWLEATLLAYQDRRYKFLWFGTCPVDNSTTYDANRDSIGIFYRAERNRLLAWLEAHPEAARGLYVIHGDDHHQSCHRVTSWKDPEPSPQAAPSPNCGEHGYVPLTVCQFSMFGNAYTPITPSSLTGLGAPWAGSKHELFFRAVQPKCIGLIEIRTDESPPRCSIRWFDQYDLTSYYHIEDIAEDLVLPASLSRSRSNQTLHHLEEVYTLPSAPSGSWAGPGSPAPSFTPDLVEHIGWNRGFERGTMEDWTVFGAAVSTADQSFEGKRSCEMTSYYTELLGDPVSTPAAISVSFTVRERTQLYVGCKVLYRSLLGQLFLQVDPGDGSSVTIGSLAGDPGSDWRSISGSFLTLGNQVTVYITLAAPTVEGQAKAWIDDVTALGPAAAPYVPAVNPPVTWS